MKTNTILIIITALVVAGGAYWYFFTGTGNEPSLTADASINVAQMRFKTLVTELQLISLDTSIFSDSRFMSLIDLKTPVTPETIGRIDPFAPIPGIITE